MHRIHQTSLDQTQTVELEQFRCTSLRCPYMTKYRYEINRHIDKCIYVTTDNDVQRALAQQTVFHQEEVQKLKELLATQSADHKDEVQKLKEHHRDELELLTLNYKDDVQQLKERYREDLAGKELEIRGLMSKLEVMEPIMTSRLKHADDLANRIADRSTISTTNNTYNHIHHVLADGKTFLEMTHPDRVKAIVQENTDKYFWQGQSGAANLVYDHVLCVDTPDMDDNKRMLLVCTDTSRKKCKYNNEKNEVVEDIGASHFLSRVAEPITEAAKEWHTTVTSQLKDEKCKKKIDAGMADKKTEQADLALMDLLCIKDENNNQRFVNKLCTLAKV
jgi:hypothetical protein